MQFLKEEVKIPLLADDMIICILNSDEFTEIFWDQKSRFLAMFWVWLICKSQSLLYIIVINKQNLTFKVLYYLHLQPKNEMLKYKSKSTNVLYLHK